VDRSVPIHEATYEKVPCLLISLPNSTVDVARSTIFLIAAAASLYTGDKEALCSTATRLSGMDSSALANATGFFDLRVDGFLNILDLL
jgi:hypothetical protein